MQYSIVQYSTVHYSIVYCSSVFGGYQSLVLMHAPLLVTLLQLMEDDIACVCALFMMRRSDKQPDRVEISPEQLTAASIEADVS